MSILDEYVTKAPSAQNMIDLFGGQWSSRLPPDCGLTATPGRASLFEDARLSWALDVFGGVVDQDVLELGPLEAGHTYMLHRAGAGTITSIEANSRAFMKCLCIKEALGLPRARFLLGDFVGYLQQCERRFGMVVASGVLYHMADPLELLKLIAKVTDKVFIWTHYYHPRLRLPEAPTRDKFEMPSDVELDGHRFELVRQHYQDALNWDGFCGGSARTSMWFTRESLFDALRAFGFSKIDVAFEKPAHPNGPAVALCASR